MFSLSLTEFVQLRPLHPEHAEDLLQLVEDSRSTLGAWMPWTHQMQELIDAEEFIANATHLYAENGAITVGLWEHHRLAGVIGFHEINWRSFHAQVGYWLGHSFEGRGLMTLALRPLIDHAFMEMELNRIEIRCAVTNTRSRGVPERLGFTLEGIVRQAEKLDDGYIDHALYGLLRQEWNFRRD
ncbi:GNAT family N-acetyltransferase [Saccharibacillus sp. JS10]|uniref:GNAT family N-acetyltransferase n=1 Tax=Saccharibacillus sp. JS10 TaxID=2950552 RepID=UPI00210D9F7B|nr:GNAT family protein [Saccharibacillus sp. JS10]MCQ4088090.1 GNAT family N-acetyltransferase [Saccharibacillus sp. JS10]